MTQTLAPPRPDAPTLRREGPEPRKRRRWRRRLGTAVVVLGTLFLAYGATIYFWQDPFTGLYTHWRQHQLANQLDQEFADFRSTASTGAGEGTRTSGQARAAGSNAADQQVLGEEVHALARRFYDGLKLGQPLGRIVIPEMGLNMVFVNGTRSAEDLSRGPGRYTQTAVPGLGTVTAIAGHRTTFAAPFRHIDALKSGDIITLELPYGTFSYRVFAHRIVRSDDWSIIRNRGFDMLVLSACHPLYSASHRWVVFARLAKVTLPGGAVWHPPGAKVVAGATPTAS